MGVEAGDTLNAEPLHHREAGAVDHREILVGESCADFPGDFQVGAVHGLDRGNPAVQALPKVSAA
jgi:hypothetical protein